MAAARTLPPRAATARLAAALLVPALCASIAAPPARAAPAHTATLTAAFLPERLGAGTTIGFSLKIATAPEQALSPLTGLELLIPAGLSIATSDLGLETCTPTRLEHDGLGGCPPDSLMGRGIAAAKVPFGSAFVTERAPIALFSGPLRDGRPQLLFFAEGEYPVLANIFLTAVVAPATAPYGGRLTIEPPLVPSLPGGPDVALVELNATLGARGITYTERAHGHTVRFHPRGILLPARCPRTGFAFAAHLRFQDQTTATAGTTVPCPRHEAPGRPSRTSRARRRTHAPSQTHSLPSPRSQVQTRTHPLPPPRSRARSAAPTSTVAFPLDRGAPERLMM